MESQEVPNKLKEYGALVRNRLTTYLPAREPRAFLYDLVADYPSRGGKMMRPGICIATARAFGAPLEAAVETATAIELFHNSLLVHDDIQDGSKERRGRPTLHELHGVPLALNAGSTLTLLSLLPLFQNTRTLGPALSARIFSELIRVAQESAEGQALELGWCRNNTVNLTESDYLEMVLKKTCWLATIFPIRVGALIGSDGHAPLDNFFNFGFLLGAAFQIQDDVLNLVGQHRQYGKELSGDLWEGKRSLILIRALSVCDSEERLTAQRILNLPREGRTTKDVAYLERLVHKYECVEHARASALALAGAARHEFERCLGHLPDSPDKRFLYGLCRWVFEQTN